MRKKQSYNIILLSLYILIFIGWSLACLLFAPGCHLLFPYSSSENNSVEVIGFGVRFGQIWGHQIWGQA